MKSFLWWLKEATDPYIEKKVDPALLTWEEFWKLVNPKNKYHPSSAYDWPVEKMNGNRLDYPELLFNHTIQGVNFEFRLKREDKYTRKYCKTDAEGEIVRIDGQIQYFTPEELQQSGMERWEYAFSVFDGEQQVGIAQDEWGTLLVAVAREFRGFGIGPMLTKMAWEAEPGKTTGGTTPAGAGVTKKAYAAFVQEYLQKGFYSFLVNQGTITAQRAKEIIASANITNKPQSNRNFGSNNPDDWLLYAQDGAFILYDKKLKDVLEEGREEDSYYWYYKLIKASCYVGGGYTEKMYILHHIGGETQHLAQFMMLLALTFVKEDNDVLRVYNDDLPLVPKDKARIDGNKVMLTGTPVDYKGLALYEKRWRRSFDKYDEFRNRLLELAESKYR